MGLKIILKSKKKISLPKLTVIFATVILNLHFATQIWTEQFYAIFYFYDHFVQAKIIFLVVHKGHNSWSCLRRRERRSVTSSSSLSSSAVRPFPPCLRLVPKRPAIAPASESIALPDTGNRMFE